MTAFDEMTQANREADRQAREEWEALNDDNYTAEEWEALNDDSYTPEEWDEMLGRGNDGEQIKEGK